MKAPTATISTAIKMLRPSAIPPKPPATTPRPSATTPRPRQQVLRPLEIRVRPLVGMPRLSATPPKPPASRQPLSAAHQQLPVTTPPPSAKTAQLPAKQPRPSALVLPLPAKILWPLAVLKQLSKIPLRWGRILRPPVLSTASLPVMREPMGKPLLIQVKAHGKLQKMLLLSVMTAPLPDRLPVWQPVLSIQMRST